MATAANVHDNHFQPMVAQFADERAVLTAGSFHAQAGDPPNMKVCARGVWNERMVVETVLSMLTTVCHFKKVGHRVWSYCAARLAYTLAVFNLLAQWDGLQLDEADAVCLSIAEFSL